MTKEEILKYCNYFTKRSSAKNIEYLVINNKNILMKSENLELLYDWIFENKNNYDILTLNMACLFNDKQHNDEILKMNKGKVISYYGEPIREICYED